MSNDTFYPLGSKRFYWLMLKGIVAAALLVGLAIVMMVASAVLADREPHGPPWPILACLGVVYPSLIGFSFWCMGYLIEVFRQGTRQADTELPPSRGLLRTLGDGIVVMVMGFLALLPLLLVIVGGTILAGGAVVAASGPLIRWDQNLGNVATVMGAIGVIAGYVAALTAFNIAVTLFLPLLHVRYAATGNPLSYFQWLWAFGALRRAGGAYLISQLPMLAYWIVYMMAYFTTLGFGSMLIGPLVIPLMLNQAYRTGRFYADHLAALD